MDKEKWISEVLDSTRHMQRQEVSPFLVEQVMARVNTGKGQETTGTHTIRWTFGVLAVLLVLINFLSVSKALHNKASQKTIATSNGGEFNNEVIYNY